MRWGRGTWGQGDEDGEGRDALFASASSPLGSAQAAVRELYAMVHFSVMVRCPEAQTQKRGKKRNGKKDESQRSSCLLTSESPV